MASTAAPSLMIFADQVAIVTGGAQGLGGGIVKMLLENGCAVMIFDVDEEKSKALCDSLRAQGHCVEFCKVDIADERSVQEGFSVFRSKFDRLDIMVNCAGIVGPTAIKTEEVKTDDFDKVYEGTYICE